MKPSSKRVAHAYLTKVAAISFNTFQKTIETIAKKMKVRYKVTSEDKNNSTDGDEFYAELGRNKISYDPVSRELEINGKVFRGIDTKQLLPTIGKNVK